MPGLVFALLLLLPAEVLREARAAGAVIED